MLAGRGQSRDNINSQLQHSDFITTNTPTRMANRLDLISSFFVSFYIWLFRFLVPTENDVACYIFLIALWFLRLFCSGCRFLVSANLPRQQFNRYNIPADSAVVEWRNCWIIPHKTDYYTWALSFHTITVAKGAGGCVYSKMCKNCTGYKQNWLWV